MPLALFALCLSLARAHEPYPARVVRVDEVTPRVAPSGKARAWPLADRAHGATAAYLGLLELAPGAHVPLHRDPVEEYLYVLEGGGTITIDGVEHRIGPGSAVFMPAGAEVSFVAEEGAPTRVVQFFAPAGPESKYDAWTAAPGGGDD